MCLELKVLHPDILLEKLTGIQLTEWYEFWKVRPFGTEIDLRYRAMLLSMIAATGGQAVSAEEFLPWKDKRKAVKQDPKALLASMPGSGAMLAMIEAKEREAKEAASGNRRDD